MTWNFWKLNKIYDVVKNTVDPCNNGIEIIINNYDKTKHQKFSCKTSAQTTLAKKCISMHIDYLEV